MNPPPGQLVYQYLYTDKPDQPYWKDRIEPMFTPDVLSDEFSVIQSFAQMLSDGSLAKALNQRLETKSSLESEFVENVDRLKEELQNTNQMCQNLIALNIEKKMTPDYPRKIYDKSKTGFYMLDSQVAKGVAGQEDFSEALIGLRDLQSALKLKSTVSSSDNRQDCGATEREKKGVRQAKK